MNKIDKQRVFELIQAYGADVTAFPEEMQAAAAACIDEDPDTFERALKEARRLDLALSSLTQPVPGEALMSRIMSDAPKPKRQGLQNRLLEPIKSFLMPNGQSWPFAAGLASLAIGTFIGLNLAASSGTGYKSEQEAVIYAALGLTEYSVDEEAYQ